MAQFEIPCGAFASFGKMVNAFVPQESPEFQHVAVWHRAGQTLLLATNRLVLAMQHLGTTTEPDCLLHLSSDPKLLDQCDFEAPFDGKLQIIAFPELRMASVKTTLGYNYPGDAFVAIPDNSEWHLCVNVPLAKLPTETNGAMAFNADTMKLLCDTSPSGNIVFQEFIDQQQPVLVRDAVDPSWAGWFLPRLSSGLKMPASNPEWWTK